MDWLIEPFEFAFQQRALLGGSLAAVSLALVGTWVVIRGMAFLGDALVHGVVPGIALAILLDFNLLLGAAVVVLVVDTTGRSSPTMIFASVLSAVTMTGVESRRASDELAAMPPMSIAAVPAAMLPAIEIK